MIKITQEVIDILKSIKDNWGDIDSAIVEGEKNLELNSKRETMKNLWNQLNETLQEFVDLWKYDDLDLDLHTVVNKTQEIITEIENKKPE